MAVALRYAARSHLGLGPKGRNEDSGYAGPHLLLIADGMGGHAAGDVASSMIVGQLAPLDEEGYNGEQAMRVLRSELRDANDALRSAMADDPELRGMGSTTIAMLRAGNKLAMAHIGDSRAFLLRGDELTQITKDHSFVQQLIDEHRITADDAKTHPQRSMVTRVMTGGADDVPDLSVRELRVGDRYLLCSDGLSDFVTAETIKEIVADSLTPAEAADRCIEVALKAHTRDNVTVVVADVVDGDEEPDLPSAPDIVGAAAVRRPGSRTRTRAIPTSPAEKAAALTREATKTPESDEPVLAEETGSPKVIWLRRGVLAAAAAVLVIVGAFAAYRWTQSQVYLSEDNGYVAVYRGVDQSLGPIELSSLVQRTDILVSDLPSTWQNGIRAAIPVPGLDGAQSKITELRSVAATCREQNAAGIACGTTLPPGVSTATSTVTPTSIAPTSPTRTATATQSTTYVTSVVFGPSGPSTQVFEAVNGTIGAQVTTGVPR